MGSKLDLGVMRMGKSPFELIIHKRDVYVAIPLVRCRKLAERAWKIANQLMSSDNQNLQADGLEWTGIAKILDELSGRFKWGILEDLSKEE